MAPFLMNGLHGLQFWRMGKSARPHPTLHFIPHKSHSVEVNPVQLSNGSDSDGISPVHFIRLDSISLGLQKGTDQGATFHDMVYSCNSIALTLDLKS